MTPIRRGLQAFAQDWRLAEVRLLIIALALAVAAVSSVGFLVDRFEAALKRDAAQLLGGDLVLSADRRLPAELIPQAQAFGLNVAETVSFPSMAAAGENSVLVAAKSVTDAYPLRGALTVQDAEGKQSEVRSGPRPGELWVEEGLLNSLNLKLGDRLQLGNLDLPITRMILVEPDRGAQFAAFAPRVMFNKAELEKSELIQPGSRVQWRMLFAAGNAAQPRAVTQWQSLLEGRLDRGQRVESLQQGRPEMQQTLDRAQRFLSLVALVAALIASVAVFLAAREYVNRQQNGIAIRRALGLDGREIMSTLAIEFAVVAILSCVLGAAIGWGVHWVLAWLLASLVGVELPPPTLRPVLVGMAIGAVLTAGVVLPRVMQLRNVPTLAVIRKDVVPLARGTLLAYVLAAAGVFTLLVLSVRDTKLAVGVAGGFAVGCLVFALIVRGTTLMLSRFRSTAPGFALRSALAACARRPQGVVVQTLALSIGLMAIALLVLIRGDLISAWQRAVPTDAPNRFVINVQPDQVEPFKKFVTDLGLPAPDLQPMIRARLIERNGKPIGPDNFDDDRAKRLVDREFNASYSATLPAHNTLAAGVWQKPDSMETSMETGIMDTLKLKLGDDLTFDVAGERVTVKITSTRNVQWDSFKVNFFSLSTPGAFGNQPKSYIASFNVPDAKAREFQAAVKLFPNITLVDTRNVIAQVQGVLNQVIRAVELLFLFALAAGVVVLFVATTATRDERKREAAVMRALGGDSGQIRATHGWEFAIIGAIAGLLAATGASVLAFLIGRYGFNFAYIPSPMVAASTIVAGVIVTLAGGWWAVRRAINAPPVVTLREAL
jgi:putative ABC transport system permease protein